MAVKSESKSSPKGKAEKAQSRKKGKKSWNTMEHLSIKRFRDDDPALTAGAKRDRTKHPYVACAEIDPSGRSTCKLCGEKIVKNSLRLCLMLECHKGYRNLCTLHQDCFFQHPETSKLENVEEIFLKDNVSKVQAENIKARFQTLKKEGGNETVVKKEEAAKSL